MAKTVGMTAAIGMRMIIDNKISLRGVLSPIYKEIYDHCLQELERYGVIMVEESDRYRHLNHQAKL